MRKEATAVAVAVATATLLGLIVSLGAGGQANHGHRHHPSVTLAWNPVPATTDPGTNPVGYRLHVGLAAGAENQTIAEGNVTSATYTGTAGTRYFFTVTAYNAAGADSVPSNEVNVTLP